MASNWSSYTLHDVLWHFRLMIAEFSQLIKLQINCKKESFCLIKLETWIKDDVEKLKEDSVTFNNLESLAPSTLELYLDILSRFTSV